MSSVSQVLEELGNVKVRANEFLKVYKHLKEQEDILKLELTGLLEAAGLKAAKGSTYSVSVVEKPYITVKDEASVIQWLESTPDIEPEAYIGLKKAELNTLALSLLKNTGEVISGTEVGSTEYLSVRANKEVSNGAE